MATIKELVHYYIQQKTPFALYRFPESDKIHLIAQPSNAATAIAAEKDFTQQKGFVFAPFVNGKYPTLFINAEKEFTFQNFDECPVALPGSDQILGCWPPLEQLACLQKADHSETIFLSCWPRCGQRNQTHKLHHKLH